MDMAKIQEEVEQELCKVTRWENLQDFPEGWRAYRGSTDKARFIIVVGPYAHQSDGTCVIGTTIVHLTKPLAEKAAVGLREKKEPVP